MGGILLYGVLSPSDHAFYSDHLEITSEFASIVMGNVPNADAVSAC